MIGDLCPEIATIQPAAQSNANVALPQAGVALTSTRAIWAISELASA